LIEDGCITAGSGKSAGLFCAALWLGYQFGMDRLFSDLRVGIQFLRMPPM
jgi:hypothetical protein